MRTKNKLRGTWYAAAAAWLIVIAPSAAYAQEGVEEEEKAALRSEHGGVEEDGAPITGKERNILEKLGDITKSEKLTITAEGYIRYWYDIQDPYVEGPYEEEAHENSFELWRFYFGIKSKLAGWLSMRFTADVGPDETTEDGEHTHADAVEADGGHKHKIERYGLFVKYAWLNIEPASGLNFRGGIIENPMNSHIDKFWGYRYVSKNVGDENKLWNSADVGAYAKYKMPESFGDVTVGVANGAGYKYALDNDKQKELWTYLMLSPLAPWVPVLEHFHVGAYMQVPMIFDDALDKELLVSPFIGWRHPWFALGYHTLLERTKIAGTDDVVWGLGHGAYFRFDTPWKVGLLARFSLWDVDRNLDAERREYAFLGGLSYSPIKLFAVAASCHVGWRSGDGDPATQEEEEEIRFLVSSHLEF